MKPRRLTTADSSDESRMLGVVDTLFEGDADYGKLTRRILRHQQRLQVLSSEDAWVAYLDLEAAVNERLSFMLAVVTRWAFREGRRSRRRKL